MQRIVSFPRSGASWLRKSLISAFGKEIHCEPYGCARKSRIRGPSNLYSNWKCPGPRLGKCSSSKPFMKSHDFDLKDPLSRSIVLLRDPQDSLMSWYEMQHGETDWGVNEIHFLNWIRKRKHYVRGFIEKWWKPADLDCLKINYTDIYLDPKMVFQTIIQYSRYEIHDVDMNQIKPLKPMNSRSSQSEYQELRFMIFQALDIDTLSIQEPPN